jgi:hypothetical protein
MFGNVTRARRRLRPMNNVYANYLRDLGQLIREQGIEAKGAAAAGDAFERGRLSGFHEVLSLMEQQATAFDLPLADLGLDGFDADRDLL